MKLEFNIDATSLGSASCIINMVRTVIGEPTKPDEGAYRSMMNAAAVYGIAGHKFVDTMFKTGGHFPSARVEAEKSFNMEKISADIKQGYLMDPKHFMTSCYNLWTNQVEEEPSFEIISIPQDCWWCKGTGVIHETVRMVSTLDLTPPDMTVEFQDGGIKCKHCQGAGTVIGPATEITFRILYYEDDYCRIYLCGTIDSVGKFKGGCYAIRDWKFTSSWRRDWITQFELSRQLRIYTLACKLMAKSNPDSILGKVGATNMGAFIDGIHIKSLANDNTYERSDVMQLMPQLPEFERSLTEYCAKLSKHLQENYFPKEGILNGSCTTLYGKCRFWHVCKSSEQVARVLLDREFQRKVYNPLAFNE